MGEYFASEIFLDGEETRKSNGGHIPFGRKTKELVGKGIR